MQIPVSADPVALARIPASTGELADQALALYDEHRTMEITTRVQFVSGAERLRDVKGLQKGLEAERVKVTGPMNEALRQVNEWFRGPMANLVKAEKVIKDALAKFEWAETAKIRAEEVKAREAARVEAEELERRARSALQKGNVDKAADLVARAATVVPQMAATAPVKAKAMAFTDVWDVTVTDPQLVPRQYLVVDEAKIKAVVKAMKGDIEIPGVTITHRRDVRSGS